LQEFPISQEFRMMDLGPGLDKALLCPRQSTANTFDWVQSERGQCVLVQRMVVRPMVRGADLHEHSNDDSEEPRQLRHRDTLHRQHGGVLFRLANK
jgi:hypothetical protein